jgi:hypothetical protein
MRKRFGILVLSLLIVAVLALAYVQLTRPPSDHARVSWEGAIAVLRTGQVTRIFQTHHLEVSMWLKNGTIMVTREPNIDTIFHEIQKCGEPCKNIETWRE